ncbi:MAG: histidine phosphatase family protein [Ruminococcaceae bacterium]|nr:histidine phosphatase family protein [Oscillospiraceae bacterium]
MICCLIRHGQDDDSVRGGWSAQPLTEEGRKQAEALAEYLGKQNEYLCLRHLYTSDLPRAVQTIQPISDALGLPVVKLSEFREVNNGELAGMDNELAKQRYPGLFWNTLGWDEKYPGGESPQDFYERITGAWTAFTARIISEGENVLLVTHSGVIHIILSLIHGEKYSNAEKQRRVPHAQPILLEYVGGSWREIL